MADPFGCLPPEEGSPMNKRDLRRLGVAAMALAVGGCDNVSQPPKSGANPLATATVIPSLDGGPPVYCVPVSDTPPVLHHGLLAKKKGHAPKGPGKKPGTGGGTTGGGVPAVKLGAPALQAGVGPDTADACDAASALLPGMPTGPGVVRECFFGSDPTPEATVERVVESVDDTDLIHVRVTFNPHFVDNSYGDTAIGWADSKKGTHTFADLVGSDHAELLFTNTQNDVALHVKLDYLSADPSQPSGYGTLGVSGGEGDVLVGNPAHVREVATSIDRNLNGCGYGVYLTSSPASDAAYTPHAAAPNWDFRVVYELWVAAEAFGSSGFGGVVLEYVHASPSKTGENTIIVEEGPCPPEDPPGDGDPPDGGEPPDGGGPPDGGTGGSNPPPAPPGCPPGTVPGDPPPPVEPPDAGEDDIPDVI